MVFKDMSHMNIKRSFRVETVNNSPTGVVKFDDRQVNSVSSVKILSLDELIGKDLVIRTLPKLEVVGIHGIDQALEKLNDFLDDLNWKFKMTWPRRSCAVLLHGGHGTGKTFLLNKLASTGWGKVHRIDSDARPSAIRETFQNATRAQPSIIIIDELEFMVSASNIAKVLGEELDQLVAEHPVDSLPKVLVVAATLDVGVIPKSLRGRGRFETDVMLPVPDSTARKAILKSLAPPVSPMDHHEVLDKLGDRTHAYTAEDLVALLQRSCYIAEKRFRKSSLTDPDQQYFISTEDIEQAMLLVRPSAMHDITLQPPKVKWDEIGGQTSVKKALQLAIEMPLKVSQHRYL